MFLVQALQYKTDQIADMKKIEKLNLLFFTLMSQGSDAESELSSLLHKVLAVIQPFCRVVWKTISPHAV